MHGFNLARKCNARPIHSSIPLTSIERFVSGAIQSKSKTIFQLNMALDTAKLPTYSYVQSIFTNIAPETYTPLKPGVFCPYAAAPKW